MESLGQDEGVREGEDICGEGGLVRKTLAVCHAYYIYSWLDACTNSDVKEFEAGPQHCIARGHGFSLPYRSFTTCALIDAPPIARSRRRTSCQNPRLAGDPEADAAWCPAKGVMVFQRGIIFFRESKLRICAKHWIRMTDNAGEDHPPISLRFFQTGTTLTPGYLERTLARGGLNGTWRSSFQVWWDISVNEQIRLCLGTADVV